MKFKSLLRLSLFIIMILLMAIAAIPMFLVVVVFLLILNRKDTLSTIKEIISNTWRTIKEVSGELIKGR